jgi:hypothetical protein
MSCQDVVFQDASCRIEVAPHRAPDGTPPFRAVMFKIGDDGVTLHPIVFADGTRAEIPGETERLAYNAAAAFLSRRFGSMTEYLHSCVDLDAPAIGEPVVVGS